MKRFILKEQERNVMQLLSETTERSTTVLAEKVATRLKKEGIRVTTDGSKITTADGVFIIRNGIDRVIKVGREYLLPAQLEIDALFALIACERTAPNDLVKVKAVNFVRELGIPVHMRGYIFLITAICIAAKEPEQLASLTKRLYPHVAELYQVDARCVERNIRNAIDAAYNRNPEQLKNCFYYNVDKPYCAEVVALAVATIRQEFFE